jgi:methionyl-tRNA formyltransferase
MRLVLCGKNDAAAEVLEFVAARGDDVWAIPVAGDRGEDGWQRSLRGAAERLGVRYDQPPRINDPAFVRRLTEFRPDALVSIQYDQILRDNLFDSIGCPCLNLHFALLPRHRGVSPIAWAILSGDAEAGVTLHHMIEDIDAGDLVAQKAVQIESDTTARELYDAVSRATVALFRECHPFGPDVLARRVRQEAGVACYHRTGDLDFSRRRIDWTQPADACQRWIRSMIFPPMQYPETTAHGRVVSVTAVGKGPGAPVPGAVPGTIVGRAADGVDVATAGGSIRIRRMIDPARPEADVTTSLAPGDRLE